MTCSMSSRSAYEEYVDAFKKNGGTIAAVFLPHPGMIDFIDPVEIEVENNKIISIGYTQAPTRVFVKEEVGLVEADLM